MSSFKTKLIDLGRIEAKKSYKGVFENLSYANDIVRVKASCGCTKAVLNKENGNIEFVYRPDGVPYHLKGQGYYKGSKYITIMYTSGETDVLIIKAEVYE